jgi:hypothetical protein
MVEVCPGFHLEIKCERLIDPYSSTLPLLDEKAVTVIFANTEDI